MKRLTLIASLLVFASSPQADVSLFHGTAGGVGSVLVHDDTGLNAAQAPTLLRDISLLEIDFVGRTEFEQLCTDRPRLRLDVPGASRLALPGGNGSLYHYRRDAAPAGVVFGWMAIGADGIARSLWEASGTGVANDTNPLIPRVAVAPDGNAFLFATTLDAGGDLFEFDLAGMTATLRTSLLPPQAFSVAGLFLASTWGIGAGPGGVLRFDRSPGAEADLVPFPGTPTWFSGEVALSGNGLVAATAAGADPTLAHMFTFASSASALQVTTTTSMISSAGYLPEHPSGPYLALSQDGSACAWITQGASREAFLAEGVGPVPVSSVLLTGDSTYLDTLDEIGVLFFVTGALILAVGESGADPLAGIENLDFYRAAMDGAGAPQLQNLSLSSGVSQPPFFIKSSVQPDLLLRLPGTDNILILDRDENTGRLLLVETGTATPTTLLSDAKAIDFMESVAGELLLAVRRTNLNSTRDLLQLSLATPTALITRASLSDNFEFDRAAVRADGWIAFVIFDKVLSAEFVARFNPVTGMGKLLVRFPLAYGPAMTWTPAGNLLFSIDVPASNSIFLGWPFAPFLVLIPDGPTAGFVLPGI